MVNTEGQEHKGVTGRVLAMVQFKCHWCGY